MILVLRKKYIILSAMLCFVMASALVGSKLSLGSKSVATSTAVNNNWGLSFSEKGSRVAV